METVWNNHFISLCVLCSILDIDVDNLFIILDVILVFVVCLSVGYSLLKIIFVFLVFIYSIFHLIIDGFFAFLF